MCAATSRLQAAHQRSTGWSTSSSSVLTGQAAVQGASGRLLLSSCSSAWSDSCKRAAGGAGAVEAAGTLTWMGSSLIMLVPRVSLKLSDSWTNFPLIFHELELLELHLHLLSTPQCQSTGLRQLKKDRIGTECCNKLDLCTMQDETIAKH